MSTCVYPMSDILCKHGIQIHLQQCNFCELDKRISAIEAKLKDKNVDIKIIELAIELLKSKK